MKIYWLTRGAEIDAAAWGGVSAGRIEKPHTSLKNPLAYLTFGLGRIGASILRFFSTSETDNLGATDADGKESEETNHKTLKPISKEELKKIIQSAHINFLIGAGCSTPFLKPLGNIEKRMRSRDEGERRKAREEYYELIKKSKDIIGESPPTGGDGENLKKTKESYDRFLRFWANVICYRCLHIVSKRINMFTTNFDMFLENSCEHMGIPYNDGFSGQINRVFDAANFNKIEKYKSMQFDRISDVPLFNIIKMHGSVSWKVKENENIVYSDGGHIDDNLDVGKDQDFEQMRENIAVVLPSPDKHLQSVMEVKYAALLRKFTLELEKENSVLIVVGFSLNDEHIKKLLYGVMKTNPTLIALYFSYGEYIEKERQLEEHKNSNLYVISPEGDFHYDFEGIVSYFSDIIKNIPETIKEKEIKETDNERQ